MQPLLVEWEDFQDGSGSLANVWIRIMVGNKSWDDASYNNKAYFVVSIVKKEPGNNYTVFVNSKPIAICGPRSLGDAKLFAMSCLPLHIANEWLTQVFSDVEFHSKLSGVM